MLNPHSLRRLENSISYVVKLELWLCGELDIDEQELLHIFSSFQSRMAVIQAIAWPSEDVDSDPVDASALEQ